MNDDSKSTKSWGNAALEQDMWDNHYGASHAQFRTPVRDGVARVLDVDKHLRRIFSEASSFSTGSEIICGCCGLCVSEGQRKVFHNGFGTSEQVKRCWCVCCYRKMLTDPGILSEMVTNRSFSWGMEVALAETVTVNGLLANCTWPEGGLCLHWAGDVNNDGYGLVVIGGVELFAHRVSFIASGRVLMPGNEVRHVCDRYSNNVDVPDRRCIKPRHLWAGSHGQNMRDRPGMNGSGDSTEQE